MVCQKPTLGIPMENPTRPSHGVPRAPSACLPPAAHFWPPSAYLPAPCCLHTTPHHSHHTTHVPPCSPCLALVLCSTGLAPVLSCPASEGPVAVAALHSRLQFHDFLIKPVQRICKYPLLLEVLRSKAHGQGVDAVIAAAVDSMRAVVIHANKAHHCHMVAARSKLIVECIELHPVCSSPQLFSMT